MLYARQARGVSSKQDKHSACSLGAYLQVGEALANHEIDGGACMSLKTIRDGAVYFGVFFERNVLPCLLEGER